MTSLLTSLTKTNAGLRYPKWIAGRYYGPRSIVGGNATTSAVTANTAYATPLWVPPGGKIVGIGLNVSSAAAAGKIARFTIHAPGSDDLPGALLLDAGTILVDTTGDKEITISYTPSPGLVWLVVVSDGTPTIPLLGTTGVIVLHGATTITGSTLGGPLRAQGDALAHDPWGAPTGYLPAGYVQVGVKAG